MALDPAFLDELRARTPIAALIGRRTKLVRSGRQFKACCPFHGEKTPSFYVYDDHFHCFGCGVHGDAISFVMQAEGSSFLEAVESLAGEAGLTVPAPSPEARGRAEQARTLGEVLEAAQAWYARQLRTSGGAAGLDYLRGRGLNDAAIAAHGLGWSGDGRGGLLDALRSQDIPTERAAEAGLMRLGDEGQPKGELFFNRVTFPIRDRTGRLISFGGRILGDGQPKYLNGPETAVFSKRRTLYGLDRAQAFLRAKPVGGASATRPLLVVEGYMDVITLHQAGFGAAVAPLGTALTEEQLEALWRLSPCPSVCFDGDRAGRAAARKAAETALKLLDPERSLRFVQLSEGQDPDSLLRTRGAGALSAAIEAAQPLAPMLFGLLAEGVAPDAGPEQRASLMARLDEAAASIGHRGLAAEYRRTLRELCFARFNSRANRANGPGRRSSDQPGRRKGPAGIASGNIVRPQPSEDVVRAERMRLMVAILLHHPDLLADLEAALCQLALPDPLARIRAGMLEWAAEQQDNPDAPAGSLDSAGLMAHLQDAGLRAELDLVVAPGRMPALACLRGGSMPAEAESAWWQFFGLVNASGLRDQVTAIRRLLIERWDPAIQKQLILLTEALSAVERGEQADDEGD